MYDEGDRPSGWRPHAGLSETGGVIWRSHNPSEGAQRLHLERKADGCLRPDWRLEEERWSGRYVDRGLGDYVGVEDCVSGEAMGVSLLISCHPWKETDIRESHDNSLSETELAALAAYGAASITRTCSRLAYQKKGRGLQASDLSLEVPTAFNLLFGDDDSKEPKL